MSNKLIKSTIVVSVMTFFSRILGYLRDAVIFIFISNTNGALDAFFVAFRIPNFLRRVTAEGAFSTAFVPVFTEYKELQDKKETKNLIDNTLGTLSLSLLIITAIGIFAAPLIIAIFAPGFYVEDDSRSILAADLLQIIFPYIFFISLTAMAGSILNSYGKFAAFSFAPVFLNLSLIIATVFFARSLETPVKALAIGVFIGGIAQLLFQIPSLYKLGLVPRFKLNYKHEGVRRIFKLMLPAIFGSSIVQINLLFDTLVASFLAIGSVSWLYISDRFVELPLAIFGIAIATVLLPKLSSIHAKKDNKGFNETLNWAAKTSLLISLPSMIGLILLAEPLLVTLLQYREFSLFDTTMASMSLIAFSTGLPAFIFIKIFAPAFYSRQDTKTPVKAGVIAMIANIAMNILFVFLWFHFEWAGPHAGLALATSLSAYLNAGLLISYLLKGNFYSISPTLKKTTISIVIACIVMSVIVFYLTPGLDTWATWAVGERIFNLLLLILLGAVSYFITLVALKVKLKEFWLIKT